MDTFSFNRHRPPIWPIEMPDEQGTIIHITLPTVDSQEELRAHADELSALLDGGNAEQRAALFDLAARLMSCNRDMMTITPEALRKTYGLDAEDLVGFFHGYVDFVKGIERAKN